MPRTILVDKARAGEYSWEDGGEGRSNEGDGELPGSSCRGAERDRQRGE